MGQDLKFDDLVPKEGQRVAYIFNNYESSNLF